MELRFFIYLIIHIDKLKVLVFFSLFRFKLFNVNFNRFKLFIENKCLNLKIQKNYKRKLN